MRAITDAEIEDGGMREGEGIEPMRCPIAHHAQTHRTAGQMSTSPLRAARPIPTGVALEEPPYQPYRRSNTDPLS